MIQANRNVAYFNTIIEILQNDQNKIKLIDNLALLLLLLLFCLAFRKIFVSQLSKSFIHFSIHGRRNIDSKTESGSDDILTLPCWGTSSPNFYFNLKIRDPHKNFL